MEEISGIMKGAVLLCSIVRIAVLNAPSILGPGTVRIWVWKSVEWSLLQSVRFKVIIIDRLYEGQKLMYFGFCMRTLSSGAGPLVR